MRTGGQKHLETQEQTIEERAKKEDDTYPSKVRTRNEKKKPKKERTPDSRA